jgi:hypothetical protein
LRSPKRVEDRSFGDLDPGRQSERDLGTGAFNKQVFSTFTGRSSPIEETKAKKITASVSAYESDFGVLKVKANRFQRSRDVLCSRWTSGLSPSSTAAT